MKPVNVHVASTGNAFMTDIAGWLVEAARQRGRVAELVTDALPADPLAANLVLAPHEFFGLHGGSDDELTAAAALSIPIATEQPGTPWFYLSAIFCRPAPLTLDINASGVTALRRIGIPAERLALGGVPSMVADPVERDIDVLFLGGSTPRRRSVLSALAPLLSRHRSEIRLFRFTSPVHGGVPGLVFGRDKYDLLARSRILVNVHRDDASPGYFEWARMVEAMANGTTVVTEPSAGFAPLEPGVHFLSTGDIAGTVLELLDGPARAAAVGRAGRDAVLHGHPLVDHLGPLLDRIDGLDLTSSPTGRRQRRRTRRKRIVLRQHAPAVFSEYRPLEGLRAQVYEALAAEQDVQRRIEAVRCRLHHGTDSHDIEFTTPAYATAAPEVSVVVTLYNYADVVTEALDSIAGSADVTSEIVVVDDHSTDTSRDVVRAFMRRRPDVPVLLLGRENNCGLPQARNHGIARARAAKVMIMDADNAVYPLCLRRLADTLDADPATSFAYCTLEAFGVDPGLRSELAWYVPWLCDVNYIDAQAMIRRDVLERHGGYREDGTWLYGVEDWDLWLRLADAGEYGVHVPEMLGRYRTQRSSMISITNLAARPIAAKIRERYPTLPWP